MCFSLFFAGAIDPDEEGVSAAERDFSLVSSYSSTPALVTKSRKSAEEAAAVALFDSAGSRIQCTLIIRELVPLHDRAVTTSPVAVLSTLTSASDTRSATCVRSGEN